MLVTAREEVGVYEKFTCSYLISSLAHTARIYINIPGLACLAAAFQGLKGILEVFCVFSWDESEARALRWEPNCCSLPLSTKRSIGFLPLRWWAPARASFMGVKCGIINSFTCQKIPRLFSQVFTKGRETMNENALRIHTWAPRQIIKNIYPRHHLSAEMSNWKR